jgi:transcription termination factor Rho
MELNDNFSLKKKKDLVAIAVHFGLMTETKANAMSKPELLSFFIEQDRQSRGDHAEEPDQTPKPAVTPEVVTEVSAEISGDLLPENIVAEKTVKKTRAKQAGAEKTRKTKEATKASSEMPEAEIDAVVNVEPVDLPAEEKFEAAAETEFEPFPVLEYKTSSKKETGTGKPQTNSRKSSKSKRRSIIIQPKKDSLYPEDTFDEEYAVPETEESAGQEESIEADAHGKAEHAVRTMRHKEPEAEIVHGILEIMQEGFGFIRRDNYLPSPNDIFLHSNYIRRFGLRTGDEITGPVRPKKESDKYAPLQYIKEVNGMAPEKMQRRLHFDKLTPIYPDEKFVLETQKTELSTRIIDLIAPIGKGQRGMIVSPPKAGKTILLQKIANAISINNPDAKLIVLLIDERPEEVTDMQRSINGEVVYSTFDKKPENHTKIVELVLERAMRLVELGQDVVILLDSMTRLSRAYNLTINPTGRTLSGGLDPGALYGPKRFFGAARNIEGGGSLTIIATSLIDTGSRMDEVIFEEFKGTGNMEVYLDRKLSEKRIFPAIDINKSGTRREELLLGEHELDAVWTIRKAFSQLDTTAVTEMIISLLLKTQTNQQFIQSVNVSFNDKAVFEAMRGVRPAGTSTTNNGNSNGKY